MIIKGNNVGYPLPDPRKGLEMQGGINMNGQKLNGLNAPMAEDEAANMGYVKRAYPHNLLDNSYFRNPVNQRGKTSYSGQGYGIDRWENWNGENVTTVNSGSVSCTKQLYQCVDPQKLKPDTRYTLAARLADGTVYCVSGQLGEKTENEKLHMEFHAETPAAWLSGGSWLWAALYEGEYTAETLPEYQPKGYGAELAECMRYYQNWKRYETAGYVTGGGMSYCMPIYLDVPMRICPSVIGTPIWGARVAAGGYSKYTSSGDKGFTDIDVYTADSKDVSWLYICDELTTAGGDTNNSLLAYRIGNLELSADL